MLTIDELRKLWMLLAALKLCDVPLDVFDHCTRLLKYIEKVGKDL